MIEIGNASVSDFQTDVIVGDGIISATLTKQTVPGKGEGYYLWFYTAVPGYTNDDYLSPSNGENDFLGFGGGLDEDAPGFESGSTVWGVTIPDDFANGDTLTLKWWSWSDELDDEYVRCATDYTLNLTLEEG